MIIGIDHGYGMVKTKNFAFSSGLTEYDHEPYTTKNVIQFKDKYYVCGSGRQSLIRDKTKDDSYYILTLAAIAKELEIRKSGNRASITLAVGLPLTSFGRDKAKFIQYLKRSSFQPVRFSYEGREYRITIENVLVYPQGYSAVIDYLGKIKNEPSVIICDVGSWTVDVMRMDNGMPNAETCRSLELGVIRMIEETQEQVRRSAGLSITAAQVEQVLNGLSCSIDENAKRIIMEQGKSYVDKLLRNLLESGFDTAAVPVVFLGGGASFVKLHFGKNKTCSMSIITDICANAKGFETIANAYQTSEEEKKLSHG